MLTKVKATLAKPENEFMRMPKKMVLRVQARAERKKDTEKIGEKIKEKDVEKIGEKIKEKK